MELLDVTTGLILRAGIPYKDADGALSAIRNSHVVLGAWQGGREDSKLYSLESLEDMSEFLQARTNSDSSNQWIFVVIGAADLKHWLEFDRIHKLGLQAREAIEAFTAPVEEPAVETSDRPFSSTMLTSLTLPTRVTHSLGSSRRSMSVADLLDMTDTQFLSLRNVGRVTMEEVRELLFKEGYITDRNQWPKPEPEKDGNELSALDRVLKVALEDLDDDDDQFAIDQNDDRADDGTNPY